MEFEVLRYSSGQYSTLGILFQKTESGKKFLCYTLEDEYRTEKVWGETRIPAGRYKLNLRQSGGFHTRYRSRFGNWHKGMIQVMDVPNFDYILWHIGNTDDDTAGCLLLGNSTFTNVGDAGSIQSSTHAYRYVYPIVKNELLSGNDCWVEYVDYDILPTN